jgi:GrpB-like predicted nucleotidyltransferase (UPF0157 family)
MHDVEIVPHDPNRETLSAVEADRLRAALDQGLIVGIEHFGSTAVRGLAPRPIIDILIVVASVARAKATMVKPMTGLGYLYWAENPKTDRMFFVKGMPPHVERRIVTEPGGEIRQRRLSFRDYPRANPGEARCHEALKRQLAARYPRDRERYTDAKTEYVEAVWRTMNLR